MWTALPRSAMPSPILAARPIYQEKEGFYLFQQSQPQAEQLLSVIAASPDGILGHPPPDCRNPCIACPVPPCGSSHTRASRRRPIPRIAKAVNKTLQHYVPAHDQHCKKTRGGQAHRPATQKLNDVSQPPRLAKGR